MPTQTLIAETSEPVRESMIARKQQGAFRLAIPAILVVLVSLVPFLNKGYEIDDPTFLLSARHILVSPMQPMSFERCWERDMTCVQSVAKLGAGSSESLMGYMMVPVVLAGGQEWVAHLIQLLFACGAVIAMARLALRLGFERVQATWAALLMAAIPPFLPLTSVLMPDTLSLALGLAGIERLLGWKEMRQKRDAVLAALALGLAPYARPHVALLIPLGALWMFDGFQLPKALQQLRRESFLWLPVVVAGSIVVALNLATRDRSAGSEHWNTLASLDYLPHNLFSYFQFLCFPIPFAAIWMAARWRRAPILLVLPAMPALVLYLASFPSHNLSELCQLAAALYGLTAVVWMIVSICFREGIDRLLCFWLLLPLPVVIYDQFPIKYLLPVMPAIVLLVVRQISTWPKQRRSAAFAAMVVAGLAYSWLILVADADFADYGRRAAAEVVAPHVAAGETVWYAGVGGFYWYAQEAGAKLFKPGESNPRPGDLLAVGLTEGAGSVPQRFPHKELVEWRKYGSPHGRTAGGGGGLWNNFQGDWLWIWNPRATNDYQVWRIR